jgi:DNA-binding MarR family transcriptional regulator
MGYLCRVGFRRFAKALENRTLPHGVSSGQWRFLRVLWRGDGITQRELSRCVDMREPTTAVAVRGLERNGFVVRRVDKDDRRKVLVFLTPKARALRDKLIPYVAEVHRIANRGIDKADIAVARKVLLTMSQNLSAEFEVGAMRAQKLRAKSKSKS